MSGGYEFWQKEAQRHDTASRALMTRVRTEISIGVTALIGIVALSVANDTYVILLFVPFLATAVWALVLWSMQESFLLDAHLMYAEVMLKREIESVRGEWFPTWASHGGSAGRHGGSIRLMIGSWGITTVAILIGTVGLTITHVGGAVGTVLGFITIILLSLLARTGVEVDRTGTDMFVTMRASLTNTADPGPNAN